MLRPFNSLDECPNRTTLFTTGFPDALVEFHSQHPFGHPLKQLAGFTPMNRGVEGGANSVNRGGARLVKRFQCVIAWPLILMASLSYSLD